MTSIIFLILLVAITILGLEIVVVLGVATIGISLISGAFPVGNIGITAFESLNSAPLIAMPLFVLAGNLILRSGIADQLVEFSKSLVGMFPGGLAITSIVASGFFAAISGSNSATVATIGQIMLPRMKKEGYPVSFTLGTVAAGGTVGIIIPPSIAFILYGFTSGVSISDLFLAGILPGILMVSSMGLVGLLVCLRFGWGQRSPFSVSGIFRSAWHVKWAALAVFIILGGIYGGVFTPTEASGVSVMYCLFIGLFVTRQFGFSDIPSILVSSARVSGIIAPILAISITLSQAMVMAGFTEVFIEALTGLTQSPVGLLLLMMGIIVLIGMFLEATPAMLILTPLFAPIVAAIGMDPVHFGVVLIVGLAIGFITPPMGLNLFVASAVGNTPIHQITKYALPYALVLFLVWLVIAFWAPLSMVLL
ncbi:TRAP transporter large permease [uncultured Sulfitobacter sp.]|uniref:TRAP transporter large permease n=1 Tax=uncultured Sulfitobacter sp. TaxID=191468 RepID=UPI002603DFA5|nr:TRAP transporter large permease [uncultured Sulfitobacter sp.]